MDFHDEKLSVISILMISGISCLFFTGLLKILDGETHAFFLKAGLVCTALAAILFLTKKILLVMGSGKDTQNTHL
jgi:inner membrane protein involved in colicin E2 resistance